MDTITSSNTSTGTGTSTSKNETILELSINDTNKLRQQLGLAPLRLTTLVTTTTSAAATATTPQTKDNHNTIQNNNNNNNDEKDTTTSSSILELSIQETNLLRQRLGLQPLRTNTMSTTNLQEHEQTNSSSTNNNKIQHVPAMNMGEQKRFVEQNQLETLKQQVNKNINQQFMIHSLTKEEENDDDDTTTTMKKKKKNKKNTTQNATVSWAQKMLLERNETTNGNSNENDDNNIIRKNQSNNNHNNVYDEKALLGLNVGHSVTDLQTDTTTILTLADTFIVKPRGDATDQNDDNNDGDNDNDNNDMELVNIDLVEQQRQKSKIREKRKVELGYGRTNGYVGYDDDEFDELGGISGTGIGQQQDTGTKNSNKRHRFVIGEQQGHEDDEEVDIEKEKATNLFKAFTGQAISLESTRGGNQKHGDDNDNNSGGMNIASDFMTTEEAEDFYYNEQRKNQLDEGKEDKNKKMKKKKKDKKEKKKKEKHKQQQQLQSSNDDHDDENDHVNSKGSILAELEATAMEHQQQQKNRRHHRRRGGGSSNDNDTNTNDVNSHHLENDQDEAQNNNNNDDEDDDTDVNVMIQLQKAKRSKYDQIMAKGNERAKLAFQQQSVTSTTTTTKRNEKNHDDDENDDDDDAFLNAALAKARRIHRLKTLANMNNHSTNTTNSAVPLLQHQQQQQHKTGADAVVDALQKVKNEIKMEQEEQQQLQLQIVGSDEGGTAPVIFSTDDTREFTKALLARTEQMEREQAKKKKIQQQQTQSTTKQQEENEEKRNTTIGTTIKSIINTDVQTTNMKLKEEEDHEDVDMDTMEDLAKEVQVDNDTNPPIFEGTTGTSRPLGRGVGTMLQVLHRSGEMTRKNVGKEEMHGRAKDKRTYEDYEPLNLQQVVHMNPNSTNTKDIELANREIKLEYRDKFGRLLTRKEAFRELSYQFHGYGSGKRKEEKKLREIQREQMQRQLLAKQVYESNEEDITTGSTSTGNAATTTSSSSSAAAGTFGAQKATQKATGKAYVIHKTT